MKPPNHSPCPTCGATQSRKWFRDENALRAIERWRCYDCGLKDRRARRAGSVTVLPLLERERRNMWAESALLQELERTGALERVAFNRLEVPMLWRRNDAD